jgi:hypothetical protein
VTTAVRRDAPVLAAAAAAAALYGLLVAQAPMIGVALLGATAVLLLAFAFPVVHFTLLLIATAIVPYTLQNRAGLGGGTGSPGLVASDLLLLTGLVRAAHALLISRRRLSTGELVALGLLTAYVGVTTIQFLRGFLDTGSLSEPGDELRSLDGVAALLVALPLLRDEGSRARLLRGMLVVGLLLGLWGVLQWALQLDYGGGFGVRSGVAQTTSGSGQLQGGLYGFPVAVILSFAALMSGALHDATARWLVTAALVLNGICVVLTFERTFLLVTVLGCGVVALRARPNQRVRAAVIAALAAVLVCVPLAVLAPTTLTTARERVLSLGQYGDDPAVRDRVLESQHVIDQIHARPLEGSGLAAVIWYGRPDEEVRPTINSFIHNGYLATAWKLGIPGAALLFASLLLAILRPGQARGSPLFGAISVGAQAALLALLVTCVTFPAVMARPITPTMGLLLAICALPRQRGRQRG